MDKFIPRTEAPKKDNKFYYSKLNPFYPKYVDNCTWYAWGRLLELGIDPTGKLPQSNAENWFNETKFEKYSYPRVGDIGCYRAGKYHYSKDGMGHVFVVEYVYPNGNILISESGTNMKFKTRTLKPPYKFYLNVSNKKNYVLEGFIHSKDYEQDEWNPGDYKVLFQKYLRKSPEVNATNKYKYANLTPNAKKKCLKDKLGYAKYKIGAEINIKQFKYDKKGNLWGRTNALWVCVCDSTGKQVKKI